MKDARKIDGDGNGDCGGDGDAISAEWTRVDADAQHVQPEHERRSSPDLNTASFRERRDQSLLRSHRAGNSRLRMIPKMRDHGQRLHSPDPTPITAIDSPDGASPQTSPMRNPLESNDTPLFADDLAHDRTTIDSLGPARFTDAEGRPLPGRADAGKASLPSSAGPSAVALVGIGLMFGIVIGWFVACACAARRTGTTKASAG